MKTQAIARLKSTAARYSRLLNIFDDEAKNDPASLNREIKDWVGNVALQLQAEADRVLQNPKINPAELKALKAKIKILNDL